MWSFYSSRVSSNHHSSNELGQRSKSSFAQSITTLDYLYVESMTKISSSYFDILLCRF